MCNTYKYLQGTVWHWMISAKTAPWKQWVKWWGAKWRKRIASVFKASQHKSSSLHFQTTHSWHTDLNAWQQGHTHVFQQCMKYSNNQKADCLGITWTWKWVSILIVRVSVTHKSMWRWKIIYWPVSPSKHIYHSSLSRRSVLQSRSFLEDKFIIQFLQKCIPHKVIQLVQINLQNGCLCQTDSLPNFISFFIRVHNDNNFHTARET